MRRWQTNHQTPEYIPTLHLLPRHSIKQKETRTFLFLYFFRTQRTRYKKHLPSFSSWRNERLRPLVRWAHEIQWSSDGLSDDSILSDRSISLPVDATPKPFPSMLAEPITVGNAYCFVYSISEVRHHNLNKDRALDRIIQTIALWNCCQRCSPYPASQSPPPRWRLCEGNTMRAAQTPQKGIALESHTSAERPLPVVEVGSLPADAQPRTEKTLDWGGGLSLHKWQHIVYTICTIECSLQVVQILSDEHTLP